MLVHMRNLLVLSALLAVAPLSAEQRGAVIANAEDVGCPYHHARASVMVVETSPEVSRAAVPIFDVGRRAPGLLP